ncbi:MAG: Ldh family oxidoreductase [Thaumarchaeota archaeon]|nr:Ldh family oxidoreductase [Nitrososphaerota archaeon]
MKSSHDAKMVVLSEAKWRRLGMAMLTKGGVPERDAKIITDTLVTGSLAGIDSHGVRNFPAFSKPSKRSIKVLRDKGATVLLDPGQTPGPVYATIATRIAIEKAKKFGIGCCSAIGGRWVTNLFGYMWQATRSNTIGMAFVRTPSAGTAWGGIKPVFGTNPLGIGFPAGKEHPVILDFATTIVSHGQTLSRALKGQPQLAGWFVDKKGHTVPETLVTPEKWEKWVTARGLVPFGTYKGWGLAVTTELMGGALNMVGTGSRSNAENGFTVVAIDVAAFSPLAGYKKEVDAYVKQVKSSGVRPGFDEVLMPGEREFKIMKQRKREGIPVTQMSWKDISDKCKTLGLDPKAYT